MADTNEIPLTRRKPKEQDSKPKKEIKKISTKKAPVISEAIKNGATKKSTIEFDGELFIRMKMMLAQRGMKMKDYINGLIEKDLDRFEK